MTGEQLRDELARIADAAPAVDVPDDVFARGRRATLRTRALTGAAVVACLTLLVGVGAQVLRSDEAPVADGTPALAVPDHLSAPPAHVTDREGDLRTGEGAAAFVTDAGIPVVVDASAGGYHLLDLPGVLTESGPFRAGPTSHLLALSPDGRQLAWAWAGPTSEQPRPSGVRVVDLTTGEVREIRLDQDHGVFVSELSWSANGRWLAWAGSELDDWTDSGWSAAGARTVGGVIEDGASTSTHVVVAGPDATTLAVDGTETSFAGDTSSAVAVSGDGRLAAVVGWDCYLDGERSRLGENPKRRVGGIWFDDGRLLGTVFTMRANPGLPEVQVLPRGTRAPVSTSMTGPDVLGAVGAGQALIHQASDYDDDPPPSVEIASWGSDSDATRIIRVDRGVLGLTLAYQLIDPEDPTVSRPEPDWPWSTERKIVVFGGSALLVVLLGAAGFVLFRRFGPISR